MIELIVLDVDGCLTDGKIVYTNNGDEIKSFNVKDGLAIKAWQRLGKHVAIITGRKSAIVTKRAKELGIVHLYQGIENKLETLTALLDDLALDASQVAAIGDDLNDYRMLQYVGQSFTPSDGSEHIREIVDHILSRSGGDAVVREMIELLIDGASLKEQFLEMWR